MVTTLSADRVNLPPPNSPPNSPSSQERTYQLKRRVLERFSRRSAETNVPTEQILNRLQEMTRDQSQIDPVTIDQSANSEPMDPSPSGTTNTKEPLGEMQGLPTSLLPSEINFPVDPYEHLDFEALRKRNSEGSSLASQEGILEGLRAATNGAMDASSGPLYSSSYENPSYEEAASYYADDDGEVMTPVVPAQSKLVSREDLLADGNSDVNGEQKLLMSKTPLESEQPIKRVKTSKRKQREQRRREEKRRREDKKKKRRKLSSDKRNKHLKDQLMEESILRNNEEILQEDGFFDCCPTVEVVVEKQLGKDRSNRAVEIHPQSMLFFERVCKVGYKDRECFFPPKSLKHSVKSRCTQQYSHSRALVRTYQSEMEWQLDFIEVRSGCSCQVSAGHRKKKRRKKR